MNVLPALLTLLVLAACADAAHKPPSSPPPPPPSPKRKSMSFQLETDSPLYPDAVTAASEWAAALGIPVTVSPDGEVPILLTPEPTCPVPANLPLGARVGACSMDLGTPDSRIEVPSYLPASHWLTALRHEMGHQLRGKVQSAGEPYHLDDPSALLWGGPLSNPHPIMPADVAFVCERIDSDTCAAENAGRPV